MSEDESGRSVRVGVRLPAHPASVAVARQVVRTLERWVESETVDRLELILSEAVTNAIRHGSPNPEARVDIELVAEDNSIAGSVRDSGGAFVVPPVKERSREDVGGFGLDIIRALTDTLVVRRHDDGNEVCFVLPADLSNLIPQ